MNLIQLLIDNPLLLLFAVVAIGYPLGRLKVRGSSLGVAAVLFAGLAIGSLDARLELPEAFYQLGLVLFVYTVGLSSGPGFFASFGRKGLRNNLLVVAMLLLAAGLTAAAFGLLRLPPALTVGMFAGALTNTPALAGALEYLRAALAPEAAEALVDQAVVGYSVAYPMGVVGMIAALAAARRVWRVDYAAEAQAQREVPTSRTALDNRTVRVTRPEAAGRPIRALVDEHGWDVVFGRVRKGGRLELAHGETVLALGDMLTAVGAGEELDRVTATLGEASSERLELDRQQLDYRRIFVSNPRLAGYRLRDLNLPQQFGAVVTRVRRGDVELLPHGDTVLELGDRVRVLTRRDQMPAVTAFFGDSYRALSEIDILTFSLGLALGLLLGLVPVPLPGGVVLRLGLAGGPLAVALVLGRLGRTGPLVWSLPYSANLTLRQIGLILFLAGVGTRAGYAFFTTLAQGAGLGLFAAGAAITGLTGLAMLWVGYRRLGIPLGLLAGMLAGLQTQPAVLGFALEQAENDLPNVGYASVFPIAMIGKIVLAQLLLIWLRGHGPSPF